MAGTATTPSSFGGGGCSSLISDARAVDRPISDKASSGDVRVGGEDDFEIPCRRIEAGVGVCGALRKTSHKLRLCTGASLAAKDLDNIKSRLELKRREEEADPGRDFDVYWYTLL